MIGEPWVDAPIMIRVVNRSNGGKPIPINSFNLTVGSTQKVINRQPDESEEKFLERTKEIGVKHLIKPIDRNHIPPAVFLYQNFDRPPEVHETAIERGRAKRETWQ